MKLSLKEDVDDEAKLNNPKLSPKYNEERKAIQTKLNEIVGCKTRNFYVLFAFVLITEVLLTAVSIYFYLIKYRAKQLLPFHYTNNEIR